MKIKINDNRIEEINKLEQEESKENNNYTSNGN